MRREKPKKRAYASVQRSNVHVQPVTRGGGVGLCASRAREASTRDPFGPTHTLRARHIRARDRYFVRVTAARVRGGARQGRRGFESGGRGFSEAGASERIGAAGRGEIRRENSSRNECVRILARSVLPLQETYEVDNIQSAE